MTSSSRLGWYVAGTASTGGARTDLESSTFQGMETERNSQ